MNACSYGSALGFRPPPVLPNQVYRLDPVTKAVKVVATDFSMCNGLAFTEDGSVAYVFVSFKVLVMSDIPQIVHL